MLIALLVCLIPTTIGALLSAIGIAGMDRLVQRNVLAMSGRAVEAAGDCSTLLLDKTGTITYGNRQATQFIPVPGVDELSLADAATSRASPTRRPKVVRSSPRRGKLRTAGRIDLVARRAGAVHRADPHEWRRPRRQRSARGPPTPSSVGS